MLIKRFFAGLSAAAVAASIAALPADADEIQADENGVYAKAGIIWMIQDQWDHKKDIDLAPTDEMETAEISGTYHNVNITGNGQYTVDMSGYHPPQDWVDIGVETGYLGVQMKFDFATHPEVTFEIDEATIDGTTYTFTKGINPETEERYQILEEPEATDLAVDGQMMIKIKNSYGNPAVTEPEMTSKAWTTTDPITITFTVSGLPTDKVEGYENEVEEQVYGSGSIDNDAAEEEPAEGEEEAAEGESEAEAEDTNEEESSAAETAATEAPADNADDEKGEDDGPNVGLIAGIAAAAVVVIGVIVFAVVKKKK